MGMSLVKLTSFTVSPIENFTFTIDDVTVAPVVVQRKVTRIDAIPMRLPLSCATHDVAPAQSGVVVKVATAGLSSGSAGSSITSQLMYFPSRGGVPFAVTFTVVPAV